MGSLTFPDGAQDEERAFGWHKIAEIRDLDFGFISSREDAVKTRFSVRVLLSNHSGNYCVISHTNEEDAEGFEPVWMPLGDFITDQEKNKGDTRSYSGSFANRRDLLIAKYYSQQKW